ncbi:MAG: hypothetical protein HN597_03575 [Desulfobacula sp.]|jgi:hypothetical protein|uniref:hypothetical protein n=1 Tax=Desulfobacula sp. TaxID=2593537 RepID=UPI0039B964CC|nr:hypothetical protein [Desulfobacula sp.]
MSKLTPNNPSPLPVLISERTARAIDFRLCRVITGPYTLASNASPNDYDIVLVDATGLNVGDGIAMFQNSSNPASYFGIVLGIAANTLTMDTPVDRSFLTASTPLIFEVNCQANVDGSVTPQIHSVVNGSTIPIHITRVIIHITDGTAMDDGTFGGIAALTRGVVLRKLNADGSFDNYWNRAVKTNGDFGLLSFDIAYDSKAPAGVYGFRMKYSFSGEDKHGVTCELLEDEQLQLVVQDDLTGLVSFQIMAEGHLDA